MLDLKQIESFYPDNLKPFKRNMLREYLQYKILEAIYISDFAGSLAFMGATAVHIIHGNTRFSEDLDFDNLGIEEDAFKRLAGVIRNKLKLEGYETEAEVSFAGAYRASVEINNILYESGLTRHREEKLLIHIVTEPQRFKYDSQKVIINKFDVFTRIDVVPIDLLLAQKIYAIMMRKRPMGRDFYDAIFLFGKTKPNLDYLKAKMGIEGAADLKKALTERCKTLDFKLLAKDVEQFLFVPSDAAKILLFQELIDGIH